MLRDFQDVLIAGNPNEIIKFYLPNAVLSVGPPGSPFFVGREAIVNGLLIPATAAFYTIPDLSQCLHSVEFPDSAPSTE